MRSFTFKTGKTGDITDHVQEFMLALLLAGRIINRHYTRSAKIASWLDLQEKFFEAGFYSEGKVNTGGNFSFSLSDDGVLTVGTKTEIAEGLTACLDEMQGGPEEMNWKQLLIYIYVFGTALSEGTPKNDFAQ